MPSKNIPVDQELYDEVKEIVKRRVKVWPSAYASGQLVTEYKRRFRELYGKKKVPYKTKKSKKPDKKTDKNGGGKSRAKPRGDLARWFEERWVNVCLPKKNGQYQDCGRDEAYLRAEDYPYCRPLYRANKETPRTVGEFSKAELKKMCRGKRRLQPGVGGKPTRIYHQQWLE